MRLLRTDGSERLDPDAVARVLRRASELSVDESEPDGIDPDALIEAADEAGIPVVAVRRALAIERLGPPPAGQVGDVVLGPPIVTVDAEVPGHATDAMARVDAWLVAGHHLRRERRREHRSEFARRTGLVGRTVRTVRSVTGEGQLGRLRRVVASAEDTGAGTCIVRIEADRSTERRTMASEGAAVTAVGALGLLVTGLLAGPVVLVAAPVVALAGVGVAARGRGRADRVEHEVELVLDAVEQGSDPTRLATDVVRRVSGRHP
jgi:hypothetical protein